MLVPEYFFLPCLFLPSVSCMHRLSRPVLKFVISSFSLVGRDCAQVRVNTKDCLDASQASFFAPLLSQAHSQQPRSCEGILKSSKTYSLLGPVLFIFASSVLNERNGRGLPCFMLTCFDSKA